SKHSSITMKMVLLGDGGVGKTSLIKQFVSGKFQGQYKATIGVDLFKKRVIIDNKRINLQVWDLAGQRFFKRYHRHFLGGALGAFLVFDLTVPPSLNSLNAWIANTKETTGNINYVLIGNKLDLHEELAVADEDIQNFLNQYPNIVDNIKTSALTGENVNEAFHTIAKVMDEHLNQILHK
ncbi:MAG: Rab family GTPase, partial [Promethearchaeota archaeon]